MGLLLGGHWGSDGGDVVTGEIKPQPNGNKVHQNLIDEVSSEELLVIKNNEHHNPMVAS